MGLVMALVRIVSADPMLEHLTEEFTKTLTIAVRNRACIYCVAREPWRETLSGSGGGAI